ncbi:MAG: sulfurtransferase TusA family protein [Paracoccaceae bacterium]
MSDIDLDARGLLCPLPVLKLRKRLQPLAVGAEFRMLADDPMARIDVAHFCAEQGHELLSTDERDGAQLYTLRKG